MRGGSRRKTYGIPQPVGGGGETDTAGSDGEREDLANDNPGTGAPSGGEEEDVDGDKGDLGIDGRDVVGNAVSSGVEMGLVETNRHTDDTDEELANEHTKGTPDQKWATTKLLNGVEGERGRTDVDTIEDQGDQEGVGDGTGRLQEWGRVVEDEVDTGPLLHHLKRRAEDGSAQVGLLMCEATLEAVVPAAEPASGRNHLSLILIVCNDLGDLNLDVLRLGRLATKAGE